MSESASVLCTVYRSEDTYLHWGHHYGRPSNGKGEESTKSLLIHNCTGKLCTRYDTIVPACWPETVRAPAAGLSGRATGASTGVPSPSAGDWGGRQCWNLAGGARCRCGYRVCGGTGVGVAAAGLAKTSSLGRTKPVPGLAPGDAQGRWEGVDTRGSLNVTRLGAGWSLAGIRPGPANPAWPPRQCRASDEPR